MSTNTVDVLFTAPHPDDIEIGMGGTVAKLVKQGYRVGLLHMTDGEPTPRGTPETRRQEAAAAAEVLGVHHFQILELTNRELMDSPATRYAVASVIRRLHPKILVGMAGRTPGASPDHYQAQLITEAARFYAQLTKWDDRFGGTAPFRVDHLVYRPVPFSAEIHHYPSRFVVDITDTIDIKLQAISCYASQFDPTRVDRLQHYVRSIAGSEGSSAGYIYGELYALPRPLGTDDLVHMVGDWKIPPPAATIMTHGSTWLGG
ncbi:MAG: N-acetyl-alpha-D-glucosaminyl L-malate deacetylase 1 [Phycisphaerae bacterium]|nr:N-acetyl-alpha-D-glucosaminyl L-malate deacetylase 1 [Phycisphaerae bacterium]